MRKRLGLNVAVLLHTVHVQTVAELFAERDQVRREAGEAHVGAVGDLEHLVKVGRHQQRLVAEAHVGRDCHAVLAAHGNHATAIVFHNTHCVSLPHLLFDSQRRRRRRTRIAWRADHLWAT